MTVYCFKMLQASILFIYLIFFFLVKNVATNCKYVFYYLEKKINGILKFVKYFQGHKIKIWNFEMIIMNESACDICNSVCY